MHNGQVCAAGSRIFVQEGVYDAFIKNFTAASQGLTHGDNFDPNVFQGPLVSEGQVAVRSVHNYDPSSTTNGYLIRSA